MTNKKLPPEVIELWPEVLEDVEVEVVPIEYLHSIRISFDDGVTWNIDLNQKTDEVDIEESIVDLIDEYKDEIINVDFRLNTEQVKKDISKRTHIFMKKRK